MKFSKGLIYIVPLALSVMITGCKDKKVEAEDVETAAIAVEESSESTKVVIGSTEETERVEKNTIAVVGNVNLRSGVDKESETIIEESSEDEIIKESSEEVESEKVDLRDNTEEEETEEEIKVSGDQYQNFIVNMNELKDYKYVGYDGDSTVFLNIDDDKETTSTLVMIYRDNSYIQDKFGGLEDLGDEQRKSIGVDLVKELTGINIDINQTDFRERESGFGGAKFLGLSFGSSDTNNSGYLAFRIKKSKLECIICTVDSTEPENRKQMKDDVLKVLESIDFNGEECNSKYDIAFDNINIGIEKMKNGE